MSSATVDSSSRTLRDRFDVSTTTIIWLAAVATLVIGAVLVAAGGGSLLREGNIVNLLSRTSVLGFIAIGQTLVILCRSLDLSVGYTAALASIVGATIMDGEPGNVVLGVVVAMAVAAAVGLANGAIVAYLDVNPFIATLGTALIIKGYLDTRYAGPVGSIPEVFQNFGYTRIAVVPLATIVMVVVAVAASVMLRRTRSGHAMYAIGGNVEAARLSGIRTGRTMVLAHVLCSMAAGLAGLLLAARFSTGVGAQIYGAGYDLDSIAAVVLGGTLLMGGRGGVAGTVAGVLILATLDTVFNLLQVDPFFRDVLRGVIIITAVALYARRQLDLTAHRRRFTDSGEPVGGGEASVADEAPTTREVTA